MRMFVLRLWKCCRSSQSKVCNIFVIASLTSIAAELRRLIGTSIPQIIDLLEDDDWNVRCATVYALAEFSENGM
jgi:hypothetical protein